ncbi:hypothetical protein RHGRI_006443 [Rhododendron griersonianum]|uniref:Protein phosphatase n=1 Tax=Rhododendron griersonianum TaxID=479676 RepID=A0AAV6KTQ1_9ERIC|nr:hypothetical protein RHGRI_006443 [Rhododendron griersonianum]
MPESFLVNMPRARVRHSCDGHDKQSRTCRAPGSLPGRGNHYRNSGEISTAQAWPDDAGTTAEENFLAARPPPAAHPRDDKTVRAAEDQHKAKTIAASHMRPRECILISSLRLIMDITRIIPKKRRRLVKLSEISPYGCSASIPKKRRRLVKLSDISPHGCSASKSIVSIEPSLKMIAGSHYIPKYNVSKPLGEDSHFICAEKQTFGVADGVSSWAQKGIDAGEYARELMENAILAIEDKPEGGVNPMAVLNEAFLNTEAQGSSTACILTLKSDVLHAVNIGDSGFMVIQGRKTVYKSPVQHWGFNCPFQLGNWRSNNPSMAEELKVAVKPGDIVVAGTDGLFDNLYESKIEELVSQGIDQGNFPAELASTIAKFALTNSMDRYAVCPFTIAAQEAGIKFTGGKIDDITVVVAYIRSPD